jgi:hypothetical protein
MLQRQQRPIERVQPHEKLDEVDWKHSRDTTQVFEIDALEYMLSDLCVTTAFTFTFFFTVASVQVLDTEHNTRLW